MSVSDIIDFQLPRLGLAHRTFCDLRLGDNLAHLHFLRALAKAYPQDRFIHYARMAYLPQLIEVVCDLDNITLAESSARWGHEDAIDGWKNAGGRWERDPEKNNYAKFYLEFFRELARRMGLHSPLATPTDLLFDYPAIKGAMPPPAQKIDWLVVNSRPLSGQWLGYDERALENLCRRLAQRGNVITTQKLHGLPCTQDWGLSVTGIGAVSMYSENILMVATGPSWPTWNVWNRDTVKCRIVFNDTEIVELAPNTHHARTVGEAVKMLELRGAL